MKTVGQQNNTYQNNKLERLKGWLEDYRPDFWETRGGQFRYGWEYLKNDVLLAIKELMKEK